MTHSTSPLILLHGALGSKSHFDQLIKALSDLKIYSMNFEGHGGRPSDRPYSIDAFSENLVNFIQENELNQANIFGYSMGGYVALKTAQRRPDLIGDITTLGTKFGWSPESAAREVKMLNPDKIEEKVPAFAKALQERHSPGDWKEVLEKTAKMMIDLGNDPALKETDLGSIYNKVLVCRGGNDRMVGEEESRWAADYLPNGSYLQLEGVPHPIEKVQIDTLLDLLQS